VEGEEIS